MLGLMGKIRMASAIVRGSATVHKYHFSRLPRQKTEPTPRKIGRDGALALSTWVVLGGGAFVFFATTSAASLVLSVANSLKLDGRMHDAHTVLTFIEPVRRWISRMIWRNIGWRVSFTEDSEINANWRDGRLCFKDVQITCGDVTMKDEEIPSYEDPVPLEESYTRFDVKIDKIELNLSLRRYLEGRGLVTGAFVEGLQGVLDRRWLRALRKEDDSAQRPLGFEINEGVVLQDVQVRVIQPRGYQSYNVNLLAAKLPRLRQRWFFYDCISADSAHGVFDGHALFAWHIPKELVQDVNVQRLRHFRMLGLNVKQLAQGHSSDHALAWVTKGSVDIEGFLQLPSAGDKSAGRKGSLSEPDDSFILDTFKEKILLNLLKRTSASPREDSLSQAEFYDRSLRPRLALMLPEELMRLSDKAVQLPSRLVESLFADAKASLAADDPAVTANLFLKASNDSIALQVTFTFRNLRARLPPTHELPLTRASLLRPVIAYINEHRPGIPLSTTIVLPQERFAGAWSGWECGVFGGVANGLEVALENLVWDPERRLRRIGKVGRWTVQGIIRNMSELADATT